MGGLTVDPDMKMTPSGACRVEFTVAVNDTKYSAEAGTHVVVTAFIRVVVWAEQAEALMEAELGRGDTVLVIGKLEQQELDKGDGKKERKTGVTAVTVTIVRKARRTTTERPW